MAESKLVQVTMDLPDGVQGTVFAAPRTFKTGSTGFYGSGKVEATNGKRYQVSVNLVLIGSKPA